MSKSFVRRGVVALVLLLIAAGCSLPGSTKGPLTITATFDTVPTAAGIEAVEYANVALENAVGTAISATGMVDDAGTEFVSPKVTTTVPNELLFCKAVTGTTNAGAGFTARSTSGKDIVEDMLVPTPSTVVARAVAVSGGASNAWRMNVATLKPR